MQCLALPKYLAGTPAAWASLGNLLERTALRPFPSHPESESVFGADCSQMHYPLGGSGKGFLAQVKTGTPDLAISTCDLTKAKSVKGNIVLEKLYWR